MLDCDIVDRTTYLHFLQRTGTLLLIRELVMAIVSGGTVDHSSMRLGENIDGTTRRGRSAVDFGVRIAGYKTRERVHGNSSEAEFPITHHPSAPVSVSEEDLLVLVPNPILPPRVQL